MNFRGLYPEAADWLPLDDIVHASSVLADPRWVEGAATLFGKARALGIPTVLDGDVADAEVFERLLPLTDHAVFSEPALASFAGSASDDALASLARFNCRVVAVTRGQLHDARAHHRQLIVRRSAETSGGGRPPIPPMSWTPRAPAMSFTAPTPLRSAPNLRSATPWHLPPRAPR